MQRHSTQKGRNYYSAQITQSYRDPLGRPRQRTLLDISSLEEEKIKAMKLALQGKKIVE